MVKAAVRFARRPFFVGGCQRGWLVRRGVNWIVAPEMDSEGASMATAAMRKYFQGVPRKACRVWSFEDHMRCQWIRSREP